VGEATLYKVAAVRMSSRRLRRRGEQQCAKTVGKGRRPV
jgi:hypothetical protein